MPLSRLAIINAPSTAPNTVPLPPIKLVPPITHAAIASNSNSCPASGEALPTLNVTGEIGLVDALLGLGLVASKNEARRLIEQGGARVDGEAATDDVTIQVGGPVRVSAGKKKHGLLVP